MPLVVTADESDKLAGCVQANSVIHPDRVGLLRMVGDLAAETPAHSTVFADPKLDIAVTAVTVTWMVVYGSRKFAAG